MKRSRCRDHECRGPDHPRDAAINRGRKNDFRDVSALPLAYVVTSAFRRPNGGTRTHIL